MLKIFLFEDLKKCVGISLLGHIVFFCIFSVSFGTRLYKIDYPVVNFRGAILSNLDLAGPARVGASIRQRTHALHTVSDNAGLSTLEKTARQYDFSPGNYVKPPSPLELNEGKLVFSEKGAYPVPVLNKPVIMFYPRLPPYFNIYFKDRQIVHIELLFNIASSGTTTSVSIKRKISSGNLEADLLSIRYISQYFFIQRMRFAPDNWQTVKIDLSTQ
jgi:hypothetical protein